MKFASASLAAVVLTAAVALYGSASALTITNTGTSEQQVTIKEGDSITTIILKPSEVRNDLCAKGCVVSHASGDEFPLTGKEELDVDESGLSIPE